MSERDRQARTAALLLLIQHRKALQAQAWDGQPADYEAGSAAVALHDTAA